jgi:hypothetical protein
MAQAVAAYLAMWQDFAAAGRKSDWESRRLATHATGAALSVMSRSLYADHYNGLITRGAPVDHPRVTSVDLPGAPTKVLIGDCGDSRHWLKYRVGDGRRADSSPGGRRAITAEVARQPGGAWKVDRFAVGELGSC